MFTTWTTVHPWALYVDGTPLASWLSLEEATEVLWDFMQSGRRVMLVRVKVAGTP